VVKRVVLTSAAILALSTSSFAQKEIIGFHQYPQFRNMLGLPGSGFMIMRDGTVDYRGAMSLSTPVAYGLKGNTWVIGGGSLSKDMTPRFPRTGKNDDLNAGANGTAQVMYGIDLKQAGTLTPAILFVSGHGDTAFNLQYTAPPLKDQPITLAAGVLDIAGGGGASGQGQPGDGDSSTSFYGVATYTVDRWDAHVSLGVGSRRFDGIFGNASISIAPNVKGYIEYDTFNWNAGVGWLVPLSKSIEKQRSLILHVGVVRGKYLSTTLNFSF
jgi:hypothetical protein